MVRLPRQTASILATLLVFLFLSSCSSFAIPGERRDEAESVYREYFLIAQEYESLKKYDKALAYYKKALASSSLYDSAYYRMGVCHVQQKDWKNAEEVFSYFLEKDGENQTVLLSLAYIKAMKGSTEEAVKMYEDLYAKNGDNPSVLKNYTAVLIQLKQYEKAESVLTEFAEKFPDDKSIQTLRKSISSGQN